MERTAKIIVNGVPDRRFAEDMEVFDITTAIDEDDLVQNTMNCQK